MRDHAETERRLIATLNPDERHAIAAGLGRMMVGNR